MGLIITLILVILLWLLFFSGEIKKQEPGAVIDWKFSVYGLSRPYYANADSKGNMYVSDTAKHRVLMFNNTGDFIKQIGRTKKDRALNAPYGIYVDEKADRLYVCDWRAASIVVFSLKTNKMLFRFPEDLTNPAYGKVFSPYQIDKYKDNFYVTSNDGIVVFTTRGKFVRKIGTRGNGVGQFNYPNSITIDPESGDLYVTDTLNRRVVAMKNNGNVRWIVGKPDILVKSKDKAKVGKLASFFQLPRSIEFGVDKKIYVSDTFANKIVVLSPEGKLLSSVGERGVEDGKFNFIEGLNMRSDGVFYIADRANDRAQAVEIIKYPEPAKDRLKLYTSQFRSYAK